MLVWNSSVGFDHPETIKFSAGLSYIIKTNKILSMSDLLLQPYTQTQYDAVSEASTDGDDQLMSVPCGMASKRKNIANNKIKSSLCKNFSEKGHCPYG